MNKIKELLIITVVFSILVYASYYIGVSMKASQIMDSSKIKCTLLVNNTTLELTNIYTVNGLASTEPLNITVNATKPILLKVYSNNTNLVFGLTYSRMLKQLIIPVPSGEHTIKVYVGVLSESNTTVNIHITGMKGNRVLCNKNVTVKFRIT